jgi:required for meiotic nuclear division protein 1
LRDLAPAFPEARLSLRELRFRLPKGEVFIYPFGAMVFHDVPGQRRDEELGRLRTARPGLTTKVVRESFSVREEAGASVGLVEGALVIDELTSTRAAVVALIVGQSAAMEYYEHIVEDLFRSTALLVEPLEKSGTVSVRTRKLHRFIGQAIATRSEVLSVLYLLDKPDATWDDAAMDLIYDDLRAEFDLVDRYAALESKLTGVQDALELVLDVARDRRLLLLETSMALLVLIELVVSVLQLRGH